MFDFIKKLAVSVFLSKEVDALKSRLAEASTALDKVEKEVVAIAKEAPAEVHALGDKLLGYVLSSADKVRSAEGPFVNEWAQKLYTAYEAAKDKVGSTIATAEALVKKTAVFFASKL